MLPRPVRAELRGLPADLADIVGAHLVAAGLLVDADPALAYRHAEAARRRAARLPVIREACAEAAYAAGEFAAALNEYRALRRMAGGDEFLPVMADCERALGRPEEALRIARESRSAQLDVEAQVEMRIIEAGAREDLGQLAEALRLLKTGVEEFTAAPPVVQARIRFACGEMLLRRERDDVGRTMLETAATLDPADVTGVHERLAELDGLSLDLDVEGEDADALVEHEAELVPIDEEKERRRTERDAARVEAEIAAAEVSDEVDPS